MRGVLTDTLDVIPIIYTHVNTQRQCKNTLIFESLYSFHDFAGTKREQREGGRVGGSKEKSSC